LYSFVVLFLVILRRPPILALFPYTTLFRSVYGKVLRAVHADNVRITLYLFKARSAPAAGDIANVFINSPHQDNDGEYFYGVLPRSEEHTSELQSRVDLVCRLLLENNKTDLR